MKSIKGVATNHLGNFAVANLPTNAQAGDTAFATNALKGGETAGTGTGNFVFFDGTNWCRVDTGAAAAA